MQPSKEGSLDDGFFKSDAAAPTALSKSEAQAMEAGAMGAKREPAAAAPPPSALLDSLQGNATTAMLGSLLQGARDKASSGGLFDVYGRIDALRPYFDVETSEVRQRVGWSFHPRKGSMLLKQYDLYAPLLLAFTLAALLLMSMKAAHRAHSADSTLIGTALGAAFTTWAASTTALALAAHGVQSGVRLPQLACAAGYALAGITGPVAVGAALPSHSLAFLAAVATLGVSSSLTLAATVASLTPRGGGGGELEPEAEPLQLTSPSSWLRRSGAAGLAAGGVNLCAAFWLRWRYLAPAA